MHLHIDCQFGMAGDMFLAALLDAGANREAIVSMLESIPLEDFSLECGRTTRGGVAAMLVDVIDLSKAARTGKHTHDHPHDCDNDSPHQQHHGEEKHSHDGSGPHRHLGDLLALLDADAIPQRVKERASRIFHILACAEAAVHGQPVEKVHFHEISGIDTAVDVIGSCIAMEMLDVDSVSASPPSVGSGMLMCEHGIFPVPAPATLEILKSNNIPWRQGGEGERATPTGIAILAGLADNFGHSPEITVTRIGYGAGHCEFDDVPNLLRVIIGKPGGAKSAGRERSNTIIAETELEASGQVIKVASDEAFLPAEIAALLPGDATPENDRVIEFRFAVDDMTAENIGYMCERCLIGGALDAYAIPAMMKKGRPGHEVTVLALPDMAGMVADCIWRESTTFGMRVGERSRLVLARDFRTVLVQGQKIRVKLGWRGGEIIRRQPEYEDCRSAAASTGVAFAVVFSQAMQAAAELA